MGSTSQHSVTGRSEGDTESEHESSGGIFNTSRVMDGRVPLGAGTAQDGRVISGNEKENADDYDLDFEDDFEDADEDEKERRARWLRHHVEQGAGAASDGAAVGIKPVEVIIASAEEPGTGSREDVAGESR